jgi:hypothetical protein
VCHLCIQTAPLRAACVTDGLARKAMHAADIQIFGSLAPTHDLWEQPLSEVSVESAPMDSSRMLKAPDYTSTWDDSVPCTYSSTCRTRTHSSFVYASRREGKVVLKFPILQPDTACAPNPQAPSHPPSVSAAKLCARGQTCFGGDAAQLTPLWSLVLRTHELRVIDQRGDAVRLL